MVVLPVIDLKDAIVVRGVAGRRDRYQPIRSRLCSDPSPRSVAAGLVASFSFRQVYVADLDAIAGAEPNWAAYEAIASAGLTLILDAGIRDVHEAREMAGSVRAKGIVERLVVGLETVEHLGNLPELVATIGSDRAVFSLDLHDGRPLSGEETVRHQTPLELASQAVEAGFRQLVVLDLAGVGVDQGVRTTELCRQIRAAHPHVAVISGGGVRGSADLALLAACGCAAALVASALHDGRLTPADVARMSLSGPT